MENITCSFQQYLLTVDSTRPCCLSEKYQVWVFGEIGVIFDGVFENDVLGMDFGIVLESFECCLASCKRSIARHSS
jgi:hypothetical protein